MKVAFDCDGTLKDYGGNLRDDMCRLLVAFIWSGAEVTVWSGGGKHYAEGVWHQVARQYDPDGLLPLDKFQCKMKDKSKPDLVFDDEHVNLGIVNVCIPPKRTED